MNNLRQISTILYKLKKDYGGPIDLRNPTDNVVNRQTGSISINYDAIHIKRAIILPAKITPSFVYDLSYAAANRNFSYGAFFGSHLRNVIVDGKDLLDDFLIKEKTEALFENAIYVLKDYHPTAGLRSYLLALSSLSSMETV